MTPNPAKIHTDELYIRYKKGLSTEELILDVREPEEFAEGHIPGARNVPVERVGALANELRAYKTVYVHCLGGGRAGRACQTLQDSGLTQAVHVADSGMRNWVQSGYPVEKK